MEYVNGNKHLGSMLHFTVKLIHKGPQKYGSTFILLIWQPQHLFGTMLQVMTIPFGNLCQHTHTEAGPECTISIGIYV